MDTQTSASNGSRRTLLHSCVVVVPALASWCAFSTRSNVAAFRVNINAPGGLQVARQARRALPLHRRRQTALAMGTREDEIKDKLTKLRRAKAQGGSYEDMLGTGRAVKGKLADNLKTETDKQASTPSVVEGTGKMESELTAGRRNITRDVDDPEFEMVDILDQLMTSAEEQASELERKWINPYELMQGNLIDPNTPERVRVDELTRAQQFEQSGGFGGSMRDAESFMNKESPLKRFEKQRAEQVASKVEAAVNATSARVTNSVGGVWAPSEADVKDTHKPAVSTWGVFERPKDISKAYGGGRDPRRRSKEDLEEDEKKAARTKELLRKYRTNNGDPVLEMEEENRPRIEAALEAVKRAMRMGDTYGAVEQLEAVKEVSSVHGLVGAKVWLELAMALETTGRSYQAQDIYKQLAQSMNEVVRKQARALNSGLDAMDKLRFSRPGEGPAEVQEVTKIWKTTTELYQSTDSYTTLYIPKDKDGMSMNAAVYSVADAKELLKKAVRERSVNNNRVRQAFSFIRERNVDVTRILMEQAALAAGSKQGAGSIQTDTAIVAPDGEVVTEEDAQAANIASMTSLLGGDVEGFADRLQGGWVSAVSAGDERVSFAARDQSISVQQGGRLLVSVPRGPVRQEKLGTWELDPAARTLRCQYSSSKVGFISMKAPDAEVLEVLALDENMLITAQVKVSTKRKAAPEVGYVMWHRSDSQSRQPSQRELAAQVKV